MADLFAVLVSVLAVLLSFLGLGFILRKKPVSAQEAYDALRNGDENAAEGLAHAVYQHESREKPEHESKEVKRYTDAFLSDPEGLNNYIKKNPGILKALNESGSGSDPYKPPSDKKYHYDSELAQRAFERVTKKRSKNP